jgi:hypothetical protein
LIFYKIKKGTNLAPFVPLDVTHNAALIKGIMVFRDYLRRFLQTGLSPANALSLC